MFSWGLKVFFFLCICRESFPNDLQFTILMRFTVDQTQTPNLKVKCWCVRIRVRVLCMSVCSIYEWVCLCTSVCGCASVDLNKQREAGSSGTVSLLLPACTYSPPKFPSILGCDWIVVRLLSCSATLVISFTISSSHCSSVLPCTPLSNPLFSHLHLLSVSQVDIFKSPFLFSLENESVFITTVKSK